MSSPFKEISDNHSRLHQQLTRTVLYITRLDTIKKKIKKMAAPYLFLFVGSGVGVGVGADILRPESELELESLKIR